MGAGKYSLVVFEVKPIPNRQKEVYGEFWKTRKMVKTYISTGDSSIFGYFRFIFDFLEKFFVGSNGFYVKFRVV